MQNSHDRVVLGAVKGIILDAFDVFPNCRTDLERDLLRLLSLVQTRGLSYLTITLPDACKHFDACLSVGTLSPFNLPGFSKLNKETPIPRFLSSLLLRVFDYSGVLCPSPDITAILFIRQLLCVAKKLRITCDESRTHESVREFFRIESEMRVPDLDWTGSALLDCGIPCTRHLSDGLHSEFHGEDSDAAIGTSGLLFQLEHKGPDPDPELLDTVQRTADVITGLIGRYDPSKDGPGRSQCGTKHGPGAVSDLSGGMSKYSFPSWPEKLERVFPCADFAFANYAYWVDFLNDPSSVSPILSDNEPPCKLIAVPKTQKGPRLIASEPTAHQWCQQSVNSFLRRQVERTFLGRSIHFRDQAYNQEGALRASKTESHWTIDLSSASDCLSLWVFERLFRRNPSLLQAIHACRTRWIENTINPDLPRYSFLKKVAPQGAAFTFPLQSICYTAVVLGCMIHAAGKQPSVELCSKLGREVLVFGDDIIAPSAIGELVVQVLTYLGFKVNDLKTFKTGKFRESCGLEAYDGVEVTPAYVLEPYDSSKPTSLASLVDCSNNFFKKGFWRAAEMLISSLPRRVLANIAVVSEISGRFGLTSFCGSYVSDKQVRYNKNTQQEERKVLTLYSNVRKIPDRGDACLLQYFTEAPDPDIFWASGIDARPVSVTRNRWVPSLFFI